jgi:iron complex outermembrane receptor protein
VDISLEQLLEAEVDKVSGASRIEQLIAEAPASVTVLGARDIQRHGWRTLADLLQTVPGMNISYNNLYTTISVRGQTSPLDLGSFLLLLVDGERLTSNVSDASLLGEDIPLDMAWIDRVEVVTGASSAVYGANATLAVVNIITRKEDSLANVEAGVEAGAHQTQGWRVAGKICIDDGYVTASASHSGSNGYLPSDDNATSRQFARLAKGDFTLTAMHLDREKSYPYLRPPFVAEGHMDTKYASAILNWRKSLSDSLQANASLQYGKSEFTVGYGNPSLIYRNYPTIGTWRGLDASLTQRLGEHTLQYGFDYMISPDTRRYGYETTPKGIRDAFDHDVSFSRHAIFFQDIWRIQPGLGLHIALRRESDERFDDSLWVPRLGLVYRYSPASTLKLTYGESFRAHPAFEISSLPSVLRPLLPKEPPEQVKQWEARIEHDINRALRVEGSVYRIETLEQLRYSPSVRNSFLLGESSRLNGIEAALSWRDQDGSRLRASATIQNGEYESDGAPLYNSPERMLKINYSVPINSLDAMLGVEALYTGKRQTLVEDSVPGYTLVNMTVSSARHAGHWQWQVGVYNIFDQDYSDPSPYGLQLGEIKQDGRSWRLALSLDI